MMDWIIDNWEIVSTVGLGVAGGIWQAVAAYRSANKAQHEAEQKASMINWEAEGQNVDWPSMMDPDSYTAELLSMYAVAAYEAQEELRISMHQKLHEEGRELFEWKYRNAFGIIVVDKQNSELVIGVAGTDSAEDAADDANVLRNTIGDWEKTAGIRGHRMIEHTKRAISSLGFTNHATLVMKGIDKCCQENNIDLSEFNRKWICGHSLGGAVSWLIGQFEIFANAMIVTYGGARPLFISSVKPSREVPVLRVCGIFDPVQFAPPHFKHPRSDQLLILGRRGRWPTIPWLYRPAFAFIAVLYWTIGIGCDVIRKVTGWNIKFSIATGHSMAGLHWVLNSEE